MAETKKRYTLPGSRRLHGRRAFGAVFAARARKQAGPLAVHARPNGRGYCRFGMSVSRKVGSAVVRSRVKRLLREAFRLSQHDWPTGYDIVVVVRPHGPFVLAEYQRLLFGAVRALHVQWQRRGKREGEGHG